MGGENVNNKSYLVQEQAKEAVVLRRKERDAAFKTLVQWLRCAKQAAELAKKEGERGLIR